jgi:hypothetical protein
MTLLKLLRTYEGTKKIQLLILCAYAMEGYKEVKKNTLFLKR